MFLCIVIISLNLFSHSFAHLTVPGLVTKRGYPVEVHHVTTSDGYILTLHRIPHAKSSNAISSKPVLVQHGLFLSSATFLLSEKALGFLLADEGYDVWLGNSRGNYESRNHTCLNPDKDPKFWHFSWHEMGMFDLPAMIDYILDVTNQVKLYYVGHSQGTTSFYVMATMLPEYNLKIEVQVSLAPVAYLKHMSNLVLRTLAEWVGTLRPVLEFFGINELLSNQGSFTRTEVAICRIGDLTCKFFFMVVFGVSPAQLEKTPLTLLAGYFSAGASIRQVEHYHQLIKSGYFRNFDFGKTKNKKLYSVDEPPSYNLSLITAPTYLFYSRGDKVVAEEDASRTCEEIGNCVERYLIPDESFNHMDYILGVNAQEVLYPRVLEVLNRY